jgi:hypothetical protein
MCPPIRWSTCARVPEGGNKIFRPRGKKAHVSRETQPRAARPADTLGWLLVAYGDVEHGFFGSPGIYLQAGHLPRVLNKRSIYCDLKHRLAVFVKRCFDRRTSRNSGPPQRILPANFPQPDYLRKFRCLNDECRSEAGSCIRFPRNPSLRHGP